MLFLGLSRLLATIAWDEHQGIIYSHPQATVKARTQERGTEVMWLHTGNHTEMMQEVTINGSYPASTRVV